MVAQICPRWNPLTSWMRYMGATGGPVRIIALVPATPMVGTQLQGRWRSAGVEVVSGGPSSVYLTRELTFSETRWTIEVTTFEDERGRAPRARMLHSGRVELGMAQPLAWVVDADFHFDERTVTPMNDEVAKVLTAAGCGSGPLAHRRLTEGEPNRLRALARAVT